MSRSGSTATTAVRKAGSSARDLPRADLSSGGATLNVVSNAPWAEIEHKSTASPIAVEFTCSPWAPLALDGHGDAMRRILTALEHDQRTLGPVVGYDDERERVDALFQV